MNPIYPQNILRTFTSDKLSLSEVKIKIIDYSTMQEKHISRSNNHKEELFAYK